MSQPKRRSRKTKLVPRSTEGGEPEIEEVIEKEEQQIKIMNTVSLAPAPTQPQPASKPGSLQFKVDIEVEEWIDDELIIEENFAKMQSEKLSEALEKEIKEEADWTNDEYGKLWAEAASDHETEDAPLNEYEKLIKNVIDPSLIAGPSKDSEQFEPEAKKAKIDKSNNKDNNEEIEPETKKAKKDKRSNKDKKEPTNKQIPKPSVKIKQYSRPEKRLKKKNEQVNLVSEVNLQPKLRINIVFDDPVAIEPVNQIDLTQEEDITPPVKEVKNKSPVKLDVSKVKRQNLPIYIIPDKNYTPESLAAKELCKLTGKDDELSKSSNALEKTKESNISDEKNDNVTPSTSEPMADLDKILAKPIYFIEMDKPAKKVNRLKLLNVANKSILNRKYKTETLGTNSTTLEHIVIPEDRILSTSDELAKTDDRVIQRLNIELKNRIGSSRFEGNEISRENALVEYALRQWFAWQGVSKARYVPVLYKCYICNNGWWHLDPFRTHLIKHSFVQITLEKHNQECNIIAYDQKPVKFRMFPIDDNCWRCSKSYGFHLGLDRTSYDCQECSSSLYTCIGLMEHIGVCLSVWKKQMDLQSTTDVKAFKCKICPQIFFSETELHNHQYLFHVPRSDYPMWASVRQCTSCNQNYLVSSFHYCRPRIQKYLCKHCLRHFPSNAALNIHLQVTKLNVKCKFCDTVVHRECCMMEHLLKHTDKFMLVYKCLKCPVNVMLKDHLMVKRHIAYIHKSIKLVWCCVKTIIPKSLYEGHVSQIDCIPLENKTDKSKNSPLKRLLQGSAGKSQEADTKEPKKDSSHEKPNEKSSQGKPKGPDPKRVMTIDELHKDWSIDESNKNSSMDELDSNEHDETNQDSSIQNEFTMNTDTMPMIKIENVMENYSEEDDHSNLEIDIKPTIISPESIKLEVQDSLEVNAADLMEFEEEIVVKKEKPDDYEGAGTSNNSGECPFLTGKKQFTEKLHNFLEKMDDGKDLSQRVNNIRDDLCVCNICDFEGTKRQYKCHLKRCTSAESEPEMYEERQCTKCQKSFKSMREYVKHLRVHGYKDCHCKECDIEFPNFSSWKTHIYSHINRTFTKVNLLSNESRVFMCKICKEIVHRNMFFKHWEVHIHQEPSLELRCAAGGAISKKLLQDIIEIFQTSVLKRIPKNCIICDRTFTRMNEKKRHLVEHLLEAAAMNRHSTGLLQCQLCRAGFYKADHFRRHMRDHAGLPVYHCELCYKTFSDSSNFVKHKKVHNLDAYICDLCNKKFLAKASLIAHIASHCPEPIICASCPDRKFYSESLYRRHVRTFHDKVKTFSCGICRNRFHTTKDKWDHQWEVHRMRSQIADCTECRQQFRKTSDLKKHLQESHSFL